MSHAVFEFDGSLYPRRLPAGAKERPASCNVITSTESVLPRGCGRFCLMRPWRYVRCRLLAVRSPARRGERWHSDTVSVFKVSASLFDPYIGAEAYDISNNIYSVEALLFFLLPNE